MNGSLTNTTIPGQSEPRSNGNELVLHICQSPWTKISPDAI